MEPAFSAFPADVGFNNGLAPAQPDYIEGLKDTFKPFPIESLGGSAAVFEGNPKSVTLSHIAGEAKLGGDQREAILQSSYDGASLVYARDNALASINEPDPLAMRL